jgi:hypothetical protein
MPSSTLTTTFSRLLICSVALGVLITMAATATNGQAIGKATSVKPQAEANARRLSAGSAVPETIRTGDRATDLRFHDNSKRSVGAKSSVRPDKKPSDPNKSAGAVDIESGSYRFVTGSPGKRSYHLKTPYGALDVRG